jgi:hypothetical protein
MTDLNRALRTELLAMAAEDARVRAELAADGSLFEGYHPRMAEVHQRNATRLEQVVDEFGWPVPGLVGDDGAVAAWRIIQHAIGNPRLQRRCLPLLEAAAAKGELPLTPVAMLTDRILFFEGKPQKYGTQFDLDDNGELGPHEIADPDGVDDRRKKVGLPPLAEQILKMREAEGKGPHPSADEVRARRLAADAWARSVGWRGDLPSTET